MARFNTIPELLDFYRERFQPQKAVGMDGVVQLNLSGDGGGQYQLIIENQTLDIQEGEHPDPTVAVKADADDWMNITRGHLNPMKAMMTGKLKIKGSIPMATKFQGLFMP